MSILVIEDDPNTREYVKALLEKRYKVEAVSDAVAAKAVMEKHAPDLVLSNVILLPEHKSNHQNIKVPVILVCNAPEALTEASATGVDDYLRKPFSERELLARVETHLRLVQMRHEAAERQSILSKMKSHSDRLEDGLKKCREQLKSTNKELDDLSYSISHDVRTPLRYINTFTDLLEKQINSATLDETSREYLQIITDSAKKADSLVKDLLQFSRLGRSELRFTTIDMEQLVQEVLKAIESENSDRKIHWHIDALSEVEGDAGMLRLVLNNLISNAVKYTRTRQSAEITIGQINQDQQIVFFIKDNGVGFDMQYVDKLFGVFKRLHLQEKFEGNGTGLANVRRIVHRHGGKTWAEAQLDQGATFYFSLPKTQGRGDE